jgi:hypothetical protein
MDRYDGLRRELGILPPLPSYYDSGALIANILGSAGKPSGLAKALTGLQKRATAGVRRSNELTRRLTGDLKIAHRAKLASFQKQADDLVRSGTLTGEQGALLDVHLGNYARRHCQ